MFFDKHSDIVIVNYEYENITFLFSLVLLSIPIPQINVYQSNTDAYSRFKWFEQF